MNAFVTIAALALAEGCFTPQSKAVEGMRFGYTGVVVACYCLVGTWRSSVLHTLRYAWSVHTGHLLTQSSYSLHDAFSVA